MIVTGSIRALNHIVKKYEDEHHITHHFGQQLRIYVREQHRIGDSNLYNLNNVDVTCRVWEARWYEGK